MSVPMESQKEEQRGHTHRTAVTRKRTRAEAGTVIKSRRSAALRKDEYNLGGGEPIVFSRACQTRVKMETKVSGTKKRGQL